ncbi:zinc finger protein [Cricetulus griseus]|uniref:Zinc finger protein n=1 Tax=Cricetulus griseus TaxID=10029 RepID=A0A061HZG2_CRIGR|nr:zinc finger protein [Cricetulus griseus]
MLITKGQQNCMVGKGTVVKPDDLSSILETHMVEEKNQVTQVEDHLGCFQFLAITNSPSMNIVKQMSLLYECASFGSMPKSGIAGSCGRLIPTFLRSRHTDFHSGCTSWHSHQQWRSVRSLFSTSSPA